MSDTGIRSEADRFITNGNASRRKGCAPTRIPVRGTIVPYPFQKETDTNKCTTAMLNRCTNVRAGVPYLYSPLVNKDPNKDHEQFHQKAN